uniref:MTHFR SAM-binding regulatory domain-containing protein n=1 Tax=Hemiselmis andersenii TaxID=464988 RepID=A0A6U4TV69_HEMAN|mmetsp:Transcript_14309/g.33073  ORF Transcript_14309/g.33073 Transcript_14309/m.33073 type:complete len:599 (-) Transcript_14309:335-2131(-)
MPKIVDKIIPGKPFYSFEYFPPKTPAGVSNLYERVERMGRLEPLFVDITWGAGGSTTDLTLELSSNFQQQFCLETQMHLTCTNISKESVAEALKAAKANGIQNILCLRGDPPKGEEKWTAVEGGFNNAIDLVKFIRAEYGDYFGISVAGYPEGHIDWYKDEPQISKDNYWKDMQYLKEKVDAGADCIITQLFYDVDIYNQWVKDCRSVGINVPIIPGIMPINTYGGFDRMVGFCKTKVPKAVREGLDAVKDNDEAVKEFGVQFVTDMCRRLIQEGAPGLHMYSLNLEKATIDILTNLGMLKDKSERRSLPWRARIQADGSPKAAEDVRPIYWANRPRSYMARTLHWDEYPNGRWGDNRSPAFGDLTNYHLGEIHIVDEADRRAEWGGDLASPADVHAVFGKYVDGKQKRLPWCCALDKETEGMRANLGALNQAGFLTINSQPRVNAAPSEDPVHGWGGPGGHVYQKAYIEFFCSPETFTKLKGALDGHKTIRYSAVNSKGDYQSTAKGGVTAVTWGVFPDREVAQPTVVSEEAFKVWKDEAFGLWNTQWKSLYPAGSASAGVIQQIHDTYYLVTVVDNDFVNGNIFAPFSDKFNIATN